MGLTVTETKIGTKSRFKIEYNGEVFNSIRAFAKVLGVNNMKVSRAFNKYKEQHGNYDGIDISEVVSCLKEELDKIYTIEFIDEKSITYKKEALSEESTDADLANISPDTLLVEPINEPNTADYNDANNLHRFTSAASIAAYYREKHKKLFDIDHDYGLTLRDAVLGLTEIATAIAAQHAQ